MSVGRARAIFVSGYVVIGAVLCVVATAIQPGVYSGTIVGRLTAAVDDDHMLVIDVRARAAREWRWSRPDNRTCDQVVLTIQEPERRVVRIDLAGGTWSADGARGELSGDGLARAIAGGGPLAQAEPSKLLGEVADLLLADFRRMCAGEFARGYHRGRQDEFFGVSYMHVVPGENWGVYALVAWWCVWLGYLLLPDRPETPGAVTPRRAALLAAGVLTAANLVMAGVGSVLPPGGLSGAAKLAVALLNLPALIVLEERYITLPGSVFSIVGGAVLVSVGVAVIRLARQRAVPAAGPASGSQHVSDT